MSTPTQPPAFNRKSPTIKRILREASELSTAPSPDYHATPLDSNLFEWHFTLRGPPSTPYASGIYHGRITLPPTYPLRPPAFRFLTPSGRFEVNREICLSISGHHEDTWQPAWGIRTAIIALRGFMETDAHGQVGGLECDDGVRRELAGESGKWRCEACAVGNGEILEESARAHARVGKGGVVLGAGPGRVLGGVSSSSLSSSSSSSLPLPQPELGRVRVGEVGGGRGATTAGTPWLDRVIALLVMVLVVYVVRRMAAGYW